jgi:hypothetical protein
MQNETMVNWSFVFIYVINFISNSIMGSAQNFKLFKNNELDTESVTLELWLEFSLLDYLSIMFYCNRQIMIKEKISCFL